jgi:hypothetical protein
MHLRSVKTAATAMTSSYLIRLIIPVAAALSRLLEEIEAELAVDKLEAERRSAVAGELN